MNRPAASVLLEAPGSAVVAETHPAASLGLERRAVDAVFRALDVVRPTRLSSRPLGSGAADYLELLSRSTYRGDRVRA